MKTIKKRDIQLIAVDLDGTLLTSEKGLAPEGARSLKAAAEDGIHVVLASTRNPHFVQTYCRTLEIEDPMICSNGAQVWGSPEGPVWVYCPIPREAALEIARLADRYGWELSTTVGDITYWRQRPGQHLGPIDANLTVVPSNRDALADDPVRILTWDGEAIECIRRLCETKLAQQCYAESFIDPDGTLYALGVFAVDANKGTALQVVLNHLGLKPLQVVAIGDNLNDLPMFKLAGTSVAMGNGPEEVKRKATLVAPNNDEEGVAWALQAVCIG